jgi:hypothetical protein
MSETKTKTKYRWECATCGEHGRWYLDGNAANDYAERHMDRFEYGHIPNIVSNEGDNYGSI